VLDFERGRADIGFRAILSCKSLRLQTGGIGFAGAVIDRCLPGWKSESLGGKRHQQVATIVIRMTSFIGEGQQCLRLQPLDCIDEFAPGRRQNAKQPLIDQDVGRRAAALALSAVVALGDELDTLDAYPCQRPPGLLLAEGGVCFARAIASPEIGIARSPVRHETHDGIGHSLQQCAVSHTFVVGMRQHQKSTPKQGLQGLHGG